MSAVQSASIGLESSAPIEPTQGSFYHIGEEVEYITLKNSGFLALGSSSIDEWFNFPWEWHYPHVCGNQPEFFQLVKIYQHWWPVSCRLRFYNLQTTGQVGANDFSGAPRNTEMLQFIDSWGVTGGPLYQPILKTKAFNEIYEDGSFMTRSNNGGSTKAFDVFSGENLHTSVIPTDYIPYESSPNVKIIPTNTSQDINFSFDMPQGGPPRTTAEFLLQTNKATATPPDINYYRFDNTHHKIFSANWMHDNMGPTFQCTTGSSAPIQWQIPSSVETTKFTASTWDTTEKKAKTVPPARHVIDNCKADGTGKWYVDKFGGSRFNKFLKYFRMECCPDAGGPVQPRIFIKNAYQPKLGNNTISLITLMQFEIEYTFKFAGKSPAPPNLFRTTDYNTATQSKLLMQPWSVPRMQ